MFFSTKFVVAGATEYFIKYTPSGSGFIAGNGLSPKMIEL
jgi:hypothetical protein